jgi:hypothetical protein
MPYEGAIRVPLAMLAPGIAAAENETLVAANLDIGATILALAGVEGHSDGVSLFDVIAGASGAGRERLLIENYGYLDYKRQTRGHELPPIIWAGVRTARYKYVEYTTGERELYDLEADPDETENLISDPTKREVIGDFAAWLMRNRGFAISTTALPAGRIGEEYRHRLQTWGEATGWSLIGSEPPPGLSLDAASGVLSGMPIAAGDFSVTVQATSSQTGRHSRLPEQFTWTFPLEIAASPQ